MLYNSVKRKLTILALVVLVGIYASTPAIALDVGSQAPEFELSGTEGSVKLSNVQEKVIYLDFWASWCGPCRESFPWMNSMQAKYKQKGLQVIAINLDANNDDAQKFLSQHAAQFTVLFDSKGVTPRQYGVKGMPTSFLIGKDGKVLVQHKGFNNSDRADLEQKIQAALEGKK
jgi:thiol-disulfide isomerase/thioredoxin